MDIHFAPLQGYTDHFYRRIHHQMAGGVACYYTPFMRWEKGDVRGKDVVDILPENNPGLHLIPQIICSSAEDLNRLTDIIQGQGYGEVDINMGCPAPMQTKLQRGSGILPHPELVTALAVEMEKRRDVSFSVKMRLGLEHPDEWQAILPILDDAPVQHITLHPRIGAQMYKGEVDMDEFARFAACCRKPLIYNGDLHTLADIHRVEAAFPHLHGIMMGRGLLARPTLAREYQQGRELSEGERRDVLLRMHEQALDFCQKKYKVDSQILLHMHSFWEYQQEFLGRKAWKKVMKAGSMKNYLAAVHELVVPS